MFQSKNSYHVNLIHPAIRKILNNGHWNMISSAYQQSMDAIFPRRTKIADCSCPDGSRLTNRTHYLFPIIYQSSSDVERYYEMLPFFYVAQSIQSRAINLLELYEIPNYLSVKCYDSFDVLESQFTQIGIPLVVTHKSLDQHTIKFELPKIRRTVVLSYFDKFDFESSEIQLSVFSNNLDLFLNEFNLKFFKKIQLRILTGL